MYKDHQFLLVSEPGFDIAYEPTTHVNIQACSFLFPLFRFIPSPNSHKCQRTFALSLYRKVTLKDEDTM